jgi:hypothetical protein
MREERRTRDRPLFDDERSDHQEPYYDPIYDHSRRGAGVDLRTLLKRLADDSTQLAHDELELAKLEVREVVEAFSSDVQEAGRTLAQNLAKVGVALVLGSLAGLALTAGFILGIGLLLGGAYWAGGLIVGGVYLAAAAMFGVSAARSLRESPELRLERGKRTMEENRQVLQDEARETKEFVREEAETFKRHATPPEEPRHRA